MSDKRRFSKEEVEFLTDSARSGDTLKESMQKFNERYPPITLDQVKAFRKNHHVRGLYDGRFKKGMVPWNKGTHICAEKCALTQWKKDHRPWNAHDVGTVILIKDTTGRVYKRIKIAEPNVWKYLHVKNWEDNYGAVPDGCMIRFYDMDPTNCDIDNLYVITKAENAVFNHLKLYPANPEQLEAAKILAKLSHIKSMRRHPSQYRKKKDGDGDD